MESVAWTAHNGKGDQKYEKSNREEGGASLWLMGVGRVGLWACRPKISRGPFHAIIAPVFFWPLFKHAGLQASSWQGRNVNHLTPCTIIYSIHHWTFQSFPPTLLMMLPCQMLIRAITRGDLITIPSVMVWCLRVDTRGRKFASSSHWTKLSDLHALWIAELQVNGMWSNVYTGM